MNKPVFRERVSENLISEFDLGRWDTRLFGLLKVKKKKYSKFAKDLQNTQTQTQKPQKFGFF